MPKRAFAATRSVTADEIDRQWYVVDAQDLILGRLATRIATILRGKHKPSFTPHTDTGDHVIVVNADKIVLMTNGPGAMVAEIVENPLPRNRDRINLHKLPDYYAVRNHLIDFLVTGSKSFRDNIPQGYDPRRPPLVRPSADTP